MESLRRDVRQALRMMFAQRAFTAATLLTLALGIGATTAMFSIVYGVLLRPLPYAESERLMRVYEEHPGGTLALWAKMIITGATIEAWQATSKTIDGIGTFSSSPFFVGREGPVSLIGTISSPSLFRLLRVQPVLGRFFDEHDAITGAQGAVVISYALWQERYGASPAAIGQPFWVNGRPNVIIGVAPRGFAFPDPDTAFYGVEQAPLRPADPSRPDRVNVFHALARLRPGATREQAVAEGTAAARSFTRTAAADRLFGKGGPVEVRVQSVVDEMTASVQPALLVLMAGVALVLLVACANVANLLLARGHGRQREMAVRAALGAPLRRLAQQLITESLVFAIVGGVLGLSLAWILIGLLPLVAPEKFPRLDAIRLDWRVLAFAFAASLVSGLLAGVLPAARGARPELEAVLRADDRRAIGGSGRVLRASLLVVEAALSVLLIVGAGLFVRSFISLISVDGGFDPSNVLVAEVYLPDANQVPAHSSPIFERLVPRLERVPGVAAVGVGNMMPFGTEHHSSSLELPYPGPDGKPMQPIATRWKVTPGFGAALGLHLTSGRFLEPGDVTSPIDVIVVNEAFVRQYFNDGKPVVGRQWTGTGANATPTEIVGVVSNVLRNGLDRKPEPEFYRPVSYEKATMVPFASVVVRTTRDPLAIASELRRLTAEVDPRAGLFAMDSLSGKVSASVAQPRFAAWLLTLFALLALAVAATGLYGVLSYSVTERRREIGVRAALGATRGRLVRLVLRQGLGFTLAGMGLGLIAAAVTSRLLSALLFGVTPYDGVAFAVAPALLLVVALAACLVPAWRAAKTDPSEALRAE
jgi:putative ABC transport system permease protein